MLVKKDLGKCKMCVDYTNLNRVCFKDSYSLPNIDRMVGNSVGYKLFSFRDAYFGYNDIPMYEPNNEKMAFMTEKAYYQYNFMHFGLKNAGSTYQRMMNEVIKEEIG